MEQIQKETITELANLLHQNNLTEIEYKTNEIYIRVATASVQNVPQTIVAPVQQNVATVSSTKKETAKTIDSPMVGVVYLSKEPTAPAFVQVGDTVSVGQVVCLIEAMKTYNPIKSTQAGRIKAVLVESGKPVEYGQPLFEIE